MSFNKGYELKKFEAYWEKLRIEYAAAGMTADAIQKMYNYDRQQFNSERTFVERTQEFTAPAYESSEEEASPLMLRYQEVITTTDTYHETKSKFAMVLAVYAKQLGAGLDEQLEKFIREHPDTRLIIIDTLQKVREVGGDAYCYANDYDIVGRMKQFADKHGVCLLLVHHTRKQQSGDKFEMISGTTGLLGCADGAFLLQKEKRTDLNAALEIVGRDQPDQKLHLTRDAEKLTWQLNHAETELWKKPPDPLLSKLAAVIAGDTPVWNGSATELVALLGEDIQPNILTRRLNVKAGELLNEYSIEYTVKRTRSGSFISLARKAV